MYRLVRGDPQAAFFVLKHGFHDSAGELIAKRVCVELPTVPAHQSLIRTDPHSAFAIAVQARNEVRYQPALGVEVRNTLSVVDANAFATGSQPGPLFAVNSHLVRRPHPI